MSDDFDWQPAPHNIQTTTLKAGMKLRNVRGEELLVGDINVNGGFCECCHPELGEITHIGTPKAA